VLHWIPIARRVPTTVGEDLRDCVVHRERVAAAIARLERGGDFLMGNSQPMLSIAYMRVVCARAG
jgi:hypothetical protein